jgi:hypothetical protein
MYVNREREVRQQQFNKDVWELSNKYTNHLINHLKDTNMDTYDLYDLSLGIYKQFLSETRSRKVKSTHKSFQCWKTMIRTLHRHRNTDIQRKSIRILHQTSVQRSY